VRITVDAQSQESPVKKAPRRGSMSESQSSGHVRRLSDKRGGSSDLLPMSGRMPKLKRLSVSGKQDAHFSNALPDTLDLGKIMRFFREQFSKGIPMADLWDDNVMKDFADYVTQAGFDTYIKFMDSYCDWKRLVDPARAATAAEKLALAEKLEKKYLGADASKKGRVRIHFSPEVVNKASEEVRSGKVTIAVFEGARTDVEQFLAQLFQQWSESILASLPANSSPSSSATSTPQADVDDAAKA